MGIKYQTCNRLPECITLLEFEKETETFLWVGESLTRKHTGSTHCYDTWVEAHEHLIQSAQYSIVDLENGLDAAKARLKRINDLKPPKSSL